MSETHPVGRSGFPARPHVHWVSAPGRTLLQSLILELNDGDGTDVAQVTGGTFAGNAAMDLDGDRQITAADLSALVDPVVGT